MSLFDDPLALGMLGGGQQNNISHQMWPIRAMHMMQARNAPRMGGMPSQQNPYVGGMGQGSDMDYSQFTYNPQLHDLAMSAGVHPLTPDQVNPNAIFPNTGFFGRHPMLTRGLEGGILGAATTGGANTWGEGISNVAQSFLKVPQLRQQLLNRQFEQPFEAAQKIESLKDLQEKRQLNAAMIQWHQAQAQAATDKNNLGYEKLEATRPVPVEGGAYTFNADKGSWDFNAGPGKTTRQEPGVAPFVHIFKEHGWDPDNATPSQWQTVNAEWRKEQTGMAGGKASAGEYARIHAELALGTKRTLDQSDIDGARKKLLDPKAGPKASFWLQAQGPDGKPIDPSDMNAREWYFENKVRPILEEGLGATPSPAPRAPGIPHAQKTSPSGGPTPSQGTGDNLVNSLIKERAGSGAGPAHMFPTSPSGQTPPTSRKGPTSVTPGLGSRLYKGSGLQNVQDFSQDTFQALDDLWQRNVSPKL